MSPDPVAESEARKRFVIIQLVRLAGVVMALFGLLTIAGKMELPLLAGYFLFVNGLFDALFLPIILSKRWKSPGG